MGSKVSDTTCDPKFLSPTITNKTFCKYFLFALTVKLNQSYENQTEISDWKKKIVNKLKVDS